jgi:predicted aspartyl protease
MVDCGATENFIDKKYAEQMNIPLNKKKIPRRVLTIDGREIASGPVMHDATVELIINNHRETIKLHCITIGNSPIIVGLPWLKKHNPQINWKDGKVLFDSEKCTKEYLEASPHAKIVSEEQAIREYRQDVINLSDNENKEDPKTESHPWNLYESNFDPVPESFPYEPTPAAEDNEEDEDLTTIIPKEYHDYLPVFEKKEMNEPPPHHHHDHRIPLIDNKIPPFEPLRALDEGRLKTLREYLNTSVQKGWIRSSTSPAGARIHFVKKKDGGL